MTFTLSALYGMNPRALTRAQYKEIQRRARNMGHAYRVGSCYVSRRGVEPCDAIGNLVTPRAQRIEAAQYARRIGLCDAARRILGKE